MEKLPRIHSFVNTLNMRNGIRLILIIPVILLSTPASFAQIDYKGFPQWSWHKQDSTEYYLYTPSDIQPGKQYPIALFMHGCCGPTIMLPCEMLWILPPGCGITLEPIHKKLLLTLLHRQPQEDGSGILII